MEQQFKLGELVKLVGIIRGVTSHSEGVFYYTIDLEGTQPFDMSTCFINGKALRICSQEDLDFFKSRERKAPQQSQEKMK